MLEITLVDEYKAEAEYTALIEEFGSVMLSLGDLSNGPNLINGGTSYASALTAYDTVMNACTKTVVEVIIYD